MLLSELTRPILEEVRHLGGARGCYRGGQENATCRNASHDLANATRMLHLQAECEPSGRCSRNDDK